MHYLGDAGISNFTTKYDTPRVVASVFIAIGATNVALTLFFLMRKNFTNTWWKRLALGLVLASAVSGMHWTAASGTTYILKGRQASVQNPLSRHWVVIIVIVMVCTCSHRSRMRPVLMAKPAAEESPSSAAFFCWHLHLRPAGSGASSTSAPKRSSSRPSPLRTAS